MVLCFWRPIREWLSKAWKVFTKILFHSSNWLLMNIWECGKLFQRWENGLFPLLLPFYITHITFNDHRILIMKKVKILSVYLFRLIFPITFSNEYVFLMKFSFLHSPSPTTPLREKKIKALNCLRIIPTVTLIRPNLKWERITIQNKGSCEVYYFPLKNLKRWQKILTDRWRNWDLDMTAPGLFGIRTLFFKLIYSFNSTPLCPAGFWECNDRDQSWSLLHGE